MGYGAGKSEVGVMLDGEVGGVDEADCADDEHRKWIPPWRKCHKAIYCCDDAGVDEVLSVGFSALSMSVLNGSRPLGFSILNPLMKKVGVP